jgi:chromosomal replication initiation ATPase DnaA
LAEQLQFALRNDDSYAAVDLVRSDCNREALKALSSWPAWPGGVLALVGPAGVGKTHMASIWAKRVSAEAPTRRAPLDLLNLAGKPVLIDDADRTIADVTLFHLINMAAQRGVTLLLTGRTPPSEWSSELPDLRSRLRAITTVEIEPPDDEMMLGVLEKLFRDHHIRPAPDLYAYLLKRIDRSIPAARDLVERLDRTAGAHGRPITRLLARQLLSVSVAPDVLGAA